MKNRFELECDKIEDASEKYRTYLEEYIEKEVNRFNSSLVTVLYGILIKSPTGGTATPANEGVAFTKLIITSCLLNLAVSVGANIESCIIIKKKVDAHLANYTELVEALNNYGTISEADIKLRSTAHEKISKKEYFSIGTIIDEFYLHLQNHFTIYHSTKNSEFKAFIKALNLDYTFHLKPLVDKNHLSFQNFFNGNNDLVSDKTVITSSKIIKK